MQLFDNMTLSKTEVGSCISKKSKIYELTMIRHNKILQIILDFEEKYTDDMRKEAI